MILNIFQLLGIVGLLLCLYEFIAMRHRDICAESDARMDAQFFYGRTPLNSTIWRAQKLYLLRGTK